MTNIEKRLKSLELSLQPAGMVKIELITIGWGDGSNVESAREYLTPAQYRARFGQDFDPDKEITVRVNWDEPEEQAG